MLAKGGKMKIDSPLSDDIWNLERRSKYVESLLAGLPMAIITVTREKDGTLRILDGGQRIKAIADYLDGKFALRNLNKMDLYEDCRYEELPSMAKSRMMYTELPINVITMPIDEKTRAEVYNRLNSGIHQVSERNRRLFQYRGRMTDLMDDLLNDKHFKALTKNNRKADGETTKEDIALRLITDCAILQETESFVTFLNVSYSEQLSGVAKMLNESVSNEYVREIRMRIKKTLKGIFEYFGKDITQRIGGSFSMALFEILYIAFLLELKQTDKEVLRDVVYKYIDDNAYKISRSGNNSVVKYRERLMLALELNKAMNI